MAKTKIGVVGCGGRMGRMLVAEIAATEGCTVAGGSEAPNSGYINQDIGELTGIGRIGIPVGEAVDKLIRVSDVVLEFTSPAATAEHAALAAGLGKAMIIGTTGLSPEQSDVVRQAARSIPIVWAPNMSLGINVLVSVVEEVARRLGTDWDIEIMEMHHRGRSTPRRAPHWRSATPPPPAARSCSNRSSSALATASPGRAGAATSVLPRCAAATPSATIM